MKQDLPITDTITIPEHELEITSSKSGGAGGQHVNKTETRITVRWNIKNSSVLTDEQKARVLEKLHSRVSTEGDLIVHNSESRSQEHNRKMALAHLAEEVKQALYIPKKRMKSKIPRRAKEARLHGKAYRGTIKKMRSKKFHED